MKTSTKQAGYLFERQCNAKPKKVQPFGAGKFSETFHILAEEDQEFILRIAPPDSMLQLFYEYRMMRQEPEIHNRLISETQVPVPNIIEYDFSRMLIDRDYLIMNKLPGNPLNLTSLNNEAFQRAFREWGEYVSQIHSITEINNHFGYIGDHRPMNAQYTWQSAFRTMYRKLLDDIKDQGIYDSKNHQMALELLDNHLEIFDHCDTARLCHGDLWVANLLVDQSGAVTGVIDFDRA